MAHHSASGSGGGRSGDALDAPRVGTPDSDVEGARTEDRADAQEAGPVIEDRHRLSATLGDVAVL